MMMLPMAFPIAVIHIQIIHQKIEARIITLSRIYYSDLAPRKIDMEISG